MALHGSRATARVNFNIEIMLDCLRRSELIKPSWVMAMCQKAKEVLYKEDTIISLTTPISVCGDIHGQFQDLLELFMIGGDAPFMSYLFLGDYVDRGYNSIETFLFLLGIKVKYPSRVYLLRGNHESREITQVYGFYDECLRKYGSIAVWQACQEVFNLLSLGATIDDKILCVHGGLSPGIKSLDQLRLFDRFQDLPHDGPMSDILWSDPDDAKGWNVSPRGAGYLFGPDIVEGFRQENYLDYICRAHQLVLEGFKWHFKNTVLTVWSAPNYCYRCGNVAAILELNDSSRVSFTVFEASPTQLSKSGQIKMPPPEYFL